jgi:hypothetical protein
MRQTLLLTLAASAVVLAGCGRGGGGSSAAAPAVAPAPPAAEWDATLQPTSSPVSGTVTLRPTADRKQTRATVTLRNSVTGLIHRWEVRPGACGDDTAAALGDAAAYGTIEVKPDGTAEAETTLAFLVPSGGTYHVNVLRSRTDATVIACGALTAI